MSKEINVLDLIEELELTNKIAEVFSKKMNIEPDKIKKYMDKKIEDRINIIGKSLSSGDMSPKEFNQSRRLSDVDLSKLNNNIIKEE
tara:strand:+ start:3538 stop:3798 length:261 start_codon:yes stop_codon:yes gene_type:complete